MIKLQPALALATLALPALTLFGCGGEIKKADLETSSMKQLSAKVGQPSPQITCPGNLKASVGESVVCSMPINGKTYDVKITVTSIDGKDAKYDVQVADKPRA